MGWKWSGISGAIWVGSGTGQTNMSLRWSEGKVKWFLLRFSFRTNFNLISFPSMFPSTVRIQSSVPNSQQNRIFVLFRNGDCDHFVWFLFSIYVHLYIVKCCRTFSLNFSWFSSPIFFSFILQCHAVNHLNLMEAVIYVDVHILYYFS